MSEKQTPKQFIKKHLKVALVGLSPAAVVTAANIWRHPDETTILLWTGYFAFVVALTVWLYNRHYQKYHKKATPKYYGEP